MTEEHDFIADEVEASDADEAELRRYLEQREEEGEGVDADLWGELEDDWAEILAEIEGKGPLRAAGEALWVGFDAEWVFVKETQQNRILSIQLFVPPDQPALAQGEARRRQIERLSRIIYARGPAKEDRPALKRALTQIVETAVEQHLVEKVPRVLYVVGFGLRFDLAAVADFTELRREVDSVSGKVATVKQRAKIEYSSPIFTGDGMRPVVSEAHFYDMAAHVPPGQTLRAVGQLLDLPKLEIPAPYSIERMDEYLAGDRAGFEAYAMRDAEIAVRYAMRLAAFARTELSIEFLPATASGLALRWFLLTLKDEGIDRHRAFGLRTVKREAYHAPTGKRRTLTEEEPIPMRQLQEELTSACYMGGRNEAYWLGPTPVGEWFDYDLAGAYSTGLMDLPLIDFEHPRASLEVGDYLGHVAGYALIDFEHPADVRFPVFAVSRGGKGLVFPLKGTTYATAPEIRAAHDLGCLIKIRWGVIYPWRDTGDLDAQGVPRTRLFAPFIKAARRLRNRFKAQLKEINAKRAREGMPEMASLEEQAAKLYANSVYGKVCQAIKSKMVFDTRQVGSIKLKPSAITNSAIGAHVTGFIRALLAEMLNQIPRHRIVVSCTTDGFLTDATEAEMQACQQGPLCRRFQALCDEIAPNSPMLEVKHRVAQIVCMKTRGQLTGLPLGDAKIVLAKAGVQPVVEAAPTLGAEAYKRLQNEKMLDLYLSRKSISTVPSKQFPSIRDQWEKGVDLFKVTRWVRLSLEPDFKRRLVNPRMERVASREESHLAMDSVPWNTAEEFDAARNNVDEWRATHCLKDLDNWQDLNDALELRSFRRDQRARGQRTINLRSGRDASDALRRGFLRAYAQEAIGLTRVMKQRELAEWLTAAGYATKTSEVTSAKSQKLVLPVVPRTDAVMVLWQLLREKFPEADLERLLG